LSGKRKISGNALGVVTTGRVNVLRHGENWLPAFGEIVVTTPSALPEIFFAGTTSGDFRRHHPATVALWLRDFLDYRDYLQTRGIYYELKTGSTNDWASRRDTIDQTPFDRPFLELVTTHALARLAGGR